MLIPVAEVENVFLSLMQGVENHLSATSTEFANNIDRYFLDHLDVAPRYGCIVRILICFRSLVCYICLLY